MEALLELLLMIILEVFSEIAFGVVGDFLLSSVRNALGFEEERRHPGLAAFGFVLLGSAAGALSAFLMPDRLTPLMPVPGLSLVIAPAITGIAMHLYGRWRRGRGHDTSYLATFWGGALTAFTIAATRFLIVG